MSVVCALGLAASLPAQSANFIESPAVFSCALKVKRNVPGTYNVVDGEKVVSYESESTIRHKKTGEIIKEITVWAGKTTSFRYGTSELLKDLLDAGELGINEDSIAGWGIYCVERDADGIAHLEARKVINGDVQSSVDVTDLILIEIIPVVSNFQFSETLTYKYDKEGAMVDTIMTSKGVYSDEGFAFITLAGLDHRGTGESIFPEIIGEGSMIEKGSQYSWHPDQSDQSQQESILTSKGVRIKNFVGYPSEADEFLLIQGSMSLSATKPVPL